MLEEEGIGIMIESDFTWYFNGTIKIVDYSFDTSGFKFISLSVGIRDYNQDGILSASDIILSIEGYTGENSNKNIEQILLWNSREQGFSKRYYYDSRWKGDDFELEVGMGIAFEIRKSFVWTPEVVRLKI